MKAVLSDTDALWWIRQARLRGAALDCVEPPVAAELACGFRELKALGAGALATRTRPAHLLVPSGTGPTSSCRIRHCGWSFERHPYSHRIRSEAGHLALPEDFCFQTAYPDVLALSPAPCVLFLSRRWPDAWIAMVVSELCGRYAMLPDESAFIARQPCCTIAQLEEFALRMRGQHGIKRFLRALDLACDHAESPFEPQVRVWLCEKNGLGGFGCGSPASNVEIDAGRSYGSGFGSNNPRIDLYWHDQRFGVECDGGQHGQQRQQEIDSLRSVRLANVGIAELRITSKAFHSLNSACEFGTSVRRRLDLPELRRDKAGLERRDALWSSLVSSPWDSRPLARDAQLSGECSRF